jgi:hypothetical protein
MLLCVYLYLLHINLKLFQFCTYMPSLLNMGICNDLFLQWNEHNEQSSSSSSSSNSNNNKVTLLIYIAIISFLMVESHK